MVSSNPFTRKGFRSVSTSIDANACLSSISFRNDFVRSLLEENVSYILEGQQTSCVMSVAAAPFNPYQPNHRMKQPSAPSVSECPGIARGVFFSVFGSVIYLPIRGPQIAAPIMEDTPPTIWIAEEPAKSMYPSLASQPPPFQTQPASIG